MNHGAMPAISITASTLGRGFSARVTWPDGKTEDAGYFRNRNEAQLWLVHEADGWVASHRKEYAFPVYAADAVNAPRAREMARALSSGSLVYQSLTPGRSAFDGPLPVAAVERLDFDRRQVDLVQAPHIDVDFVRI